MNNSEVKKYGPMFGERLYSAGGLIIISVLAWAYTIRMARTMGAHSPAAGIGLIAWGGWMLF